MDLKYCVYSFPAKKTDRLICHAPAFWMGHDKNRRDFCLEYSVGALQIMMENGNWRDLL